MHQSWSLRYHKTVYGSVQRCMQSAKPGEGSVLGSRTAAATVRSKTIPFYSDGVVIKGYAVIDDARPICRFTPERVCCVHAR